jgi:hypothetical protein
MATATVEAEKSHSESQRAIERRKRREETLKARLSTHAEERKKGLKSSRVLKVLGATFLISGAAALTAGIAFAPMFVTTDIILGGLASSVWGLGVFVAGNIKGYFNKRSKA